MSARLGQYLNEIVSLSVLMLMASALIAGRAGASAEGTAHSAVSMSAPVVDASTLVETGASAITLRIDLVLEEVAESLPVHETTEAIVEVVGNIVVPGK
jgi:hypothetical protein